MAVLHSKDDIDEIPLSYESKTMKVYLNIVKKIICSIELYNLPL